MTDESATETPALRPSGTEQHRLDEARSRLFEHPGYREHQECEALRQTLAAVFVPNLRDLVALLETAATDEELAIELVQNACEPVVRDRFRAALARCLRNYLASTTTFIDHVRRLMRGRAGPIAEDFERRKRELLDHPEVPFMQDLRNFTLHRRLPFLGHTFSISGADTDAPTVASEVELSTTQLLEWSGWSVPARRFIEDAGTAIGLRPVVRFHGELVLGINTWVHGALVEAIPIDELNELVVEVNVALARTDTESARRLADEPTALRGRGPSARFGPMERETP